MSIDTTMFSNIKFSGVSPYFGESGWNFKMPASFNWSSLWESWNGSSGLTGLSNLNVCNNWNLGIGNFDTDFVSDLWKSFSVNNQSNVFNFSWSGFNSADKLKLPTYTSYASMSREAALKAASADPNLEKLTGGTGWSVSDGSFIYDIPYAKKGTGAVLEKAASLIGESLVVTSALGTKDSPHVKNSGSVSHYNSNNPKLDLGGGLTPDQANSLKTKLDSTGLFSRITVESDGATAHLDVQIADSAFEKLNTLA